MAYVRSVRRLPEYSYRLERGLYRGPHGDPYLCDFGSTVYAYCHFRRRTDTRCSASTGTTGALSRGLSPEHEQLADSDDVKLRLGAISNYGKQKGVDSLIVADLIDLARNHAISDAVLLSGDEDTRIGVQIAQSFGVRVHLVGIKVPDENQSLSLMRESDTTTVWCREDLSGFLTRTSTYEVAVDVRGAGDARAVGSDQTDHEKLAECVAELVGSCSPEETVDDNGSRTELACSLCTRPQITLALQHEVGTLVGRTREIPGSQNAKGACAGNAVIVSRSDVARGWIR